MIKTSLCRTSVTIAVLGAGVLVAAGAAQAETTFDNPSPTTYFCPSGLADSTVVAQTSADEDELQPGQVSFEVDDSAGSGANIAWINTDTMQYGMTAMTPGDDAEPEALVDTGPGAVSAAVYGIYTNDAGERCLLVPGVNTAIDVPAVETQ